MTTPNQWYYVKKNERCGPVEAVILKQLADAGEIKPSTLVWRVGMADWIEAEQVQGLFPKPVPSGTPSITPEYHTPSSRSPSPVHPSTPSQQAPVRPVGPQAATPTPGFGPQTTQAAQPQTAQPQAARPQVASPQQAVFAKAVGPSDAMPPLDKPAQWIQPEPRIMVPPKKTAEKTSAGGHPVGWILDILHAKVGPSFVDASVRLFTLIGFWAVLAYAAILLIGSVVTAIQLETTKLLGFQLGFCILVLVLHYPAIKVLDLLGKWKLEAKVPCPFFDTVAALAVLAGVAILITLTVWSVKLGTVGDRIILPYIFWGIAAFVVLFHLATVAISFPEWDDEADNDPGKDDPSIADMAYSLFGGIMALIVRTVPVLFGIGVTLCCLELLYSLRSSGSFVVTTGYEVPWMLGYLLLPAIAYLLLINGRFFMKIFMNLARLR